MKTPRKSVYHLLFGSKPNNQAKHLSLFPHLLESPPKFHLLPTKTLSNSSLIPNNTYISTTTLIPKPANFSKMDSSAPNYLIPLRNATKPDNFIQRRPFSSSKLDQSDFVASDAIPVTVSSPLEASSPIDAGSSIRKLISLCPGTYHFIVTNALWEARSKYFEKTANASENVSAHSELIPKNPSQSRTSILYKFLSDYILREQYRNPWNEIRMGKLLEDLDALAGIIS